MCRTIMNRNQREIFEWLQENLYDYMKAYGRGDESGKLQDLELMCMNLNKLGLLKPILNNPWYDRNDIDHYGIY